MTTKRVIPGWPEADEHLARGRQKRVHDTQDFRRVGEMLEGIQRNDNIRKLSRRRYEQTSILKTRTERLLSGGSEIVFKDIDTDYPPGPSSSHFYGIGSFATAEVDDHFPGNPGEEVMAHENRDLRLALVSAPATAVRGSGREPL